MTILKNIPWKALLIFIAGLIIGLSLGSKGTLNIITKVFDTNSVSEALNKPTQETVVNNKVELNKPNLKKSENLTFKFEPITVQEPTLKITPIVDSCYMSFNEYYKLKKRHKNSIERWRKE